MIFYIFVESGGFADFGDFSSVPTGGGGGGSNASAPPFADFGSFPSQPQQQQQPQPDILFADFSSSGSQPMMPSQTAVSLSIHIILMHVHVHHALLYFHYFPSITIASNAFSITTCCCHNYCPKIHATGKNYLFIYLFIYLFYYYYSRIPQSPSYGRHQVLTLILTI